MTQQYPGMNKQKVKEEIRTILEGIGWKRGFTYSQETVQDRLERYMERKFEDWMTSKQMEYMHTKYTSECNKFIYMIRDISEMARSLRVPRGEDIYVSKELYKAIKALIHLRHDLITCTIFAWASHDESDLEDI